MKKFLTIMTAAAVLLCGLVMTGCGMKEIIKETIDDSYKTWYKYEKAVTVPLGSSDESESNNSLKDAELYVYFDPDVGLKAAIQSTSTQDVELVKGLFTTQVELVTGGTKEYTKEQFGKGKWAALWASGKFEKSDEPKVSKEPEKCMILFGEDKNEFQIQWKKVIANYILNWSEQ